MVRKQSETLTEVELKLMEILWDSGPSSVRNVIQSMKGKKPAYSTVLTFMRILERKGYIRHNKKGRAFVYYHVINKSDARENVVSYVVNKFFNKSHSELLQNLLENKNLSAEDIKQLQKLIKTKEKE